MDNIEQKIEEKLEKMKRQIDENKKEGGSMLEEINKRIELIEKEVFKTYSQIKVRSLVHSESKSQITKSVHLNHP